ncbi:MAG: hydrogenase maturation protease [Thermodesulfobacteriota bacterium]
MNYKMDQDGILIIGIGNIFRGDDAAGLAAARLLREMQLPGVKVLELDGDISALAEGWQGAQRVVVIDAVASQSEAGRIFRFAAHGEPLPRKLFATCCSCHAFGLAEQIEIARSLQQLPPSLMVYGLEGQDFMLGSGLSPEVQEALPRLVAQIRQDLGFS